MVRDAFFHKTRGTLSGAGQELRKIKYRRQLNRESKIKKKTKLSTFFGHALFLCAAQYFEVGGEGIGYFMRGTYPFLRQRTELSDHDG